MTAPRGLLTLPWNRQPRGAVVPMTSVGLPPSRHASARPPLDTREVSMSKLKLLAALAVVAIGIVAAPLSASGPPSVPVVANWAETDNLTALGYAPRPTRPRACSTPTSPSGATRVPGHVRRVPDRGHQSPSRPKEVLFQPCNGNQGDIVIWGKNKDKPDLLVRSYNTPAPAGVTCDGRRSGRVRGHPRVRPLELRGSAAGRAGAGVRRVAHSDAGAGHGQQPSDHLQPDVGRDDAVHLDHLGAVDNLAGTSVIGNGPAHRSRRLP